MSNKWGSTAFEQHYVTDGNTPSESDVRIGVIWVDTDDGTVYVCTSLGPIVFTQISGTGLANIVEDLSPQLGAQLDVNGFGLGDGTLELLTFTEVALAVNHVNVANNDTGDDPKITAAGDDTNINIHVEPKGTGAVEIDRTIPSTAAQELVGVKAIIDSSAQVSTSEYITLLVETTGTPAGVVAALGVIGKIDPIRHEAATPTTPSQTEFAGRKTGGGMTWADGIDGLEIFVVDNDEIYVGAAAQFDDIEVIMTTPATKNVQPTFHYNTAADTWTEFFPEDGTNGFQQSANITWLLSGISGSWTGDGDPGAGDTTAGFWIKIIRTRNGDPGAPVPATVKTAAETVYEWDNAGALTVKSINTAAVPKIVYTVVIANDTVLTTGDGKHTITIPSDLNGMDLVDADIVVYGSSSSGLPTVQLHNLDYSGGASDMLSTLMTIDTSELSSYTATTPPVIDTSKDDVATGDRIRIDVDVAGTGTDGLDVIMVFQTP